MQDQGARVLHIICPLCMYVRAYGEEGGGGGGGRAVGSHHVRQAIVDGLQALQVYELLTNLASFFSLDQHL